MNKNVGKVTAVAGSVVLVGSGLFAALPALTQEVPEAQSGALAVTEASSAALPEQAAQHVEGSFSFTQDVVSGNDYISGVFKKAMATLCSGMPEYQAVRSTNMTISGDNQESFDATVESLAEDEGAASYTIGCACSSNAPGGGAVVNAEVSGVSLESVAQAAGAR